MRNERRGEDGVQVESSRGVMNSPRWRSASGGWNLKRGGGRKLLKGRGEGGVPIIVFHLDNHSI